MEKLRPGRIVPSREEQTQKNCPGKNCLQKEISKEKIVSGKKWQDRIALS